MWPAILSALRIAAPAALGYLTNDVFAFVGKTWTTLNPFDRDANGNVVGVKIFYALLFFVLGGFLLAGLIGILSGKKGKRIFSGIVYAIVVYQYFNPGSDGVIMATALMTLTSGAAVLTSQNSTYVPKYFWYTAATQLTGFKITVQGDGVIFDYDAPGLNHAGVVRLLGQVTNTFFFRLANGFIQGKNVLWEVTNSAAQTPIVFVDSDETPPKGRAAYLQSIRQPIVGPGGTDLQNFAMLHLPSLSATDYVNILFSDGTQQSNMLRVDLQAMLQMSQNVVNTPLYSIDNYGQRVVKVNIQVGITQTGYIQRWVAPVANGMINQAPVARG